MEYSNGRNKESWYLGKIINIGHKQRNAEHVIIQYVNKYLFIYLYYSLTLSCFLLIAGFN